MKAQIYRFIGWIIALSAVVLIGGAMRGLDLETSTAPFGVISLQLARTPHEVSEILAGWAVVGKLSAARTNILLDFAFIASYVTALLLTLLWATDQARIASRHLSPRAFWSACAAIVFVLAWLQIVAGLADVLENIGQLRYLDGKIDPDQVRLVWISTAVKYGIVLTGLAVFVVMLLVWLVLPWRLYRRLVQ